MGCLNYDYKYVRFFFVKQRKAGELDDEILQFTSQVLHENPDIYTLWNIRKEAIILIKEKT